jgi:hypothetical protein
MKDYDPNPDRGFPVPAWCDHPCGRTPGSYRAALPHTLAQLRSLPLGKKKQITQPVPYLLPCTDSGIHAQRRAGTNLQTAHRAGTNPQITQSPA